MQPKKKVTVWRWRPKEQVFNPGKSAKERIFSLQKTAASVLEKTAASVLEKTAASVLETTAASVLEKTAASVHEKTAEGRGFSRDS